MRLFAGLFEDPKIALSDVQKMEQKFVGECRSSGSRNVWSCVT